MIRSSRSFAQDITKPDRKSMIDPAIFEGVSWRNSGYAAFPANPGFTGPPGIFDFAFPAGSSGFAGPSGVFPGFPGFPTDAPGFTSTPRTSAPHRVSYWPARLLWFSRCLPRHLRIYH
jgi:hypothetical protein